MTLIWVSNLLAVLSILWIRQVGGYCSVSARYNTQEDQRYRYPLEMFPEGYILPFLDKGKGYYTCTSHNFRTNDNIISKCIEEKLSCPITEVNLETAVRSVDWAQYAQAFQLLYKTLNDPSILKKQKVNVIFLGGSMTYGSRTFGACRCNQKADSRCTISKAEPRESECTWATLLSDWMRKQFPAVKFNFFSFDDVPERSIKSLYPPQAQTPLIDAAPDNGVQIPTSRTKRMHRRDFLLAKYDRILAAYDYHDHRTNSPNPGTSIHSGSTEEYSQQIGVKVVGSGSTELEEHVLTHTEVLEVGEARAKRLSRKVKKKLHSLHKHIADLQRVARAIMETYIYNGADHQVNLPDTMRADCVKRFTLWCDSMEHTHDGSHSTCLPDNSTTSVCIQENEELQIPDTARNRWDPKQSDIHEPRKAKTPPHTDSTVYNTVLSVDNIDMSFVDLFKGAKGEVLKLLRDGMFPRWKNTPDFHSFIEGIKPYNAVMEESIHDGEL